MIAIKPDGRKIPIRSFGKLDPLFSLKLQGMNLRKDTIVFLTLETTKRDRKLLEQKIINRIVKEEVEK